VTELVLATDRLHVYQGDALEVLRELSDECVDCVVTSPPYWNLRDYGVAGQIGLERTPAAYVEKIVAVFAEVRRVLKHDGTCWVNMGDSYANRVHGKSQTYGSRDGRLGRGPRPVPMRTAVGGLKVKDLVGMPWRVAFALQSEGWYLRSDIVWSKPNPMPESATDRPTHSHEYVFLLTKGKRYHFDAAAIAEPVSLNTHLRVSQNVAAQVGSLRANGGTRRDRPMKAVVKRPAGWNDGDTALDRRGRYINAPKTREKRADGVRNNQSFADATVLLVTERNSRSVWEIATEPYAGAHYATFPPELPRRAILAGCPAGGVVLDPFAGTGTVLQVANSLDRRAVGIELDPESVDQIRRRCDEWQRVEWDAADPLRSPDGESRVDDRMAHASLWE